MQPGDRHARGHTLLRASRRDPGERIARAMGRGPREQRLQVGKPVGDAVDGVGVGHGAAECVAGG